MTVFPPEDLDRFRLLYPHSPGKLSHRLTEHSLLTLEALVELGRRMDPATVEYNAGDLPIGIDPADIERTGLTVEDTIRGIEQCGSWMVLKNVETVPEYRALLEDSLSEVRQVVEPVTGEMMSLAAFIFISSPGAVTPFHFDPEHNILLQIRGSKTMMITPGDEDVVSPEKHEEFHIGGHRNIPWRDEFTRAAESFDLCPGEAIHVPVKRPHWVKNGSEPSISFSITWRSRWSYEEADARGMNHMLRRAGIDPAAPAHFPRRNLGKSLAYRALRRVRGQIGG